MNCLAIVLIWNIIWFIPLDFIKFALQAAFDRSLRTVKPFEHIHRRRIALKQAETTVLPSDVVEQIIDDRREHSKRLAKQEQTLEVGETTSFATKFDQVAQAGSSFYSPYTDTLSVLRRPNRLLRSRSLN